MPYAVAFNPCYLSVGHIIPTRSLIKIFTVISFIYYHYDYVLYAAELYIKDSVKCGQDVADLRCSYVAL